MSRKSYPGSAGNLHVADFARSAIGSAVQLALDEDTGANAFFQGQEYKVILAFRYPERSLTKSAQVAFVLDGGQGPKRSFQHPLQRKMFPAWEKRYRGNILC